MYLPTGSGSELQELSSVCRALFTLFELSNASLLPEPEGCCGVPPFPQPSSPLRPAPLIRGQRVAVFPDLSSRPASRFPQEPAVPAGRNGKGPEIVTEGQGTMSI